MRFAIWLVTLLPEPSWEEGMRGSLVCTCGCVWAQSVVCVWPTPVALFPSKSTLASCFGADTSAPSTGVCCVERLRDVCVINQRVHKQHDGNQRTRAYTYTHTHTHTHTHTQTHSHTYTHTHTHTHACKYSRKPKRARTHQRSKGSCANHPL